jgi:hypothetical protein
LLNNVSIFDGTVNGGSAPFDTDITLTVGDVLDFAVGTGGNGYGGDATGLDLVLVAHIIGTGGDTGIEGVTVTLTGTDVNGPVSRTTVIGPDGSYSFGDVFAGEYTITADQPAGYLDGKETAGSLGGTVDNTQDSQSIDGITIENGDADATGYNFAEIQPSDAMGLVWEDFNNDGEVNFGEKSIEDAIVHLTGTDDRGNAVSRWIESDVDGVYMFIDLRPGEYLLSEEQPAGYSDGHDVAGTVNGNSTGVNSANDVITLASGRKQQATWHPARRPRLASGRTRTART